MLSVLLPKLHAPLRSSLSLAGVATTCLCQTGRAMSSQSFSSTLPIKRPTTPPSLLLDIPIEEELMPGYNPKYFHYPNPGDILAGRYELNAKLGFGSTSTVWLARDKDMEDKSYVAIKICTSNVQDEAVSEHELRISKHIVECAQGDESKYLNLRTIRDGFSVQGTHGTHLCLVMEPMREPIWLTRRRLTKTSKATPATMVIFKMFLQDLVAGLKYLHECNIIHTGKL
jgi:serine/threonine-protein kinase SRPK3